MVGQIRQTNRRSPRVTKRNYERNNLEKEPRDADRNNAQVKDREGDAQSKRLRSQPGRDGEAQIDEDLKGLLEKLADDKPVIQENCKEEPEITILRKSGTASDRNTSKVTNLDGKEVVQSLVEKIPAELLEQTRVRRKRVEFKEEAEYLGPGQESGELSTSTEEENTEGESLSGECEMWDEDSEASSDNQDSLCMILAEEKIRHHDRELQTDPSSGTFNLDVQEIRGG